MDYSKLSDQEIAANVLIAQGYKLIDDGYGYSIYISDSGRKDTGPKASKQFAFDPCNNPADAWPIIMKSRINIQFDLDETFAWGYDKNAQVLSERDRKTFRAAMIVFLMMQEG